MEQPAAAEIKDQVAERIGKAAYHYEAGSEDLYDLLHERAHVLGSEAGEDWRGKAVAAANLGTELRRIRDKRQRVAGALLEFAKNPDPAEIGLSNEGDVAWWTTTGNLVLDDEFHSQTSWTVVLSKDKAGEWKIAHSHFSIHR